jgi:shikimate kinase
VEQQLVLVTGPIGAGKSTVARTLGAELARLGIDNAVVDLDDIVFMQSTPAANPQEIWRRGRSVHAALVARWFQEGVHVVVAHGPFVGPDEESPLLVASPAARVRRLLLWVSYETAAERVQRDSSRGLSADPDFLRQTHQRFREMAAAIPTPEWEIDTEVTSPGVIAELIACSIVHRK